MNNPEARKSARISAQENPFAQVHYEHLREAKKTVLNYLDLKDTPRKADVIFVLGGSSLEPVRKAAELYKGGFAPKVAFISTGGTYGGEKVFGMKEHEKYWDVLIEAGVAPKDIITEGLTTNTLVEAQQAIPFIKGHFIDAKSMILVSRPFHQRRAFATFSQQHPEIEYINCPADEASNLEDIEVGKRLVEEIERLLDYSSDKKEPDPKYKDILKLDIPTEVLKAAAFLRKELKDLSSYTPRTKPGAKA
jgi:uncharacterized SAM-binding protein YcdF (DUF218 family)